MSLLTLTLFTSHHTCKGLAFHELMTNEEAIEFADLTFPNIGKANSKDAAYPMAAPLITPKAVLTLDKDYLGQPFVPTSVEFEDVSYQVEKITLIPGENFQICWLDKEVENIQPIPLNEDIEENLDISQMVVISFGPTCDPTTRKFTHDYLKKAGTTTIEQRTKKYFYTLFKEPELNKKEERLAPITPMECTLLLEDAGAILLSSHQGRFSLIGIGKVREDNILIGLTDQPYYGHQSTYIRISPILQKIEIALGLRKPYNYTGIFLYGALKFLEYMNY